MEYGHGGHSCQVYLTIPRDMQPFPRPQILFVLYHHLFENPPSHLFSFGPATNSLLLVQIDMPSQSNTAKYLITLPQERYQLYTCPLPMLRFLHTTNTCWQAKKQLDYDKAIARAYWRQHRRTILEQFMSDL